MLKAWNWFRHNIEFTSWTIALVGLYFLPHSEGHFTLCPLGAMGMSWCPGCGLGHSIHEAMHGNFHSAFQHHYLGVFGLAVILFRNTQLFLSIISSRSNNYGR